MANPHLSDIVPPDREAFAGLGLVATEIFRYNRQNFAFDQDQRFNRGSVEMTSLDLAGSGNVG